MNEFNQSWKELEEFLKSKGNPNPSGIISMIRYQIKRCILPSPSSSGTDRYSFELSEAEIYGVQQFLTKFGFHLVYQPTVSSDENHNCYTISKNW